MEKLAIAIRMLSGASYLDLYMIYSAGTSDLYTSFNTAIKRINDTLKIPLVTALMNEVQAFFQYLLNEFSVVSEEKFVGWIGTIDKLAVKIRCPTVNNDLGNPGSYFTRIIIIISI